MKKNSKNPLIPFVFIVIIVAAMILISAGEQIGLENDAHSLGTVSYYTDISRCLSNIDDNINQKIFDLPKVYTLPMDQSPGPEPDPDGFTKDSYTDSTISVKCWHERINISGKTVTAHFADVVIAHPTQLRTAFAGGQFGNKRMLASKIAANHNAVVAINGDFYNYNGEGIIIRNGTVYREKPYGTNVLFIDSDGNFSLMLDNKAFDEGYYKKNKIMQTLSFGPAIVENGKKLTNWKGSFSCGPNGDEPRTAIGQIGHLHYILCTVDGRTGRSPGVTVAELSKIMIDKECMVAYNLDGGQSSVLYFHDKPINLVADGGERTLGDIIYFATAIPESDRN